MAQCSDLEEKVVQAINLLEESNADLRNLADKVTQLEGIAKARFGLNVVAEWMIKVHIKRETVFNPPMIDHLFRAAKAICSHDDQLGPR